jgi:hypothetical protein
MKVIMFTKDLKRLIKSTAKFISKDENRPLLQYIRLDFEKEGSSVKAIGIDGFKMSVEKANFIGTIDENFTVYIKQHLPPGAKSEYAIIELSGDNCLIEIDGRIVGCKQPKGAPLNYTDIIANWESVQPKHKVKANADYLLDALRSIVQENKLEKKPVTLELREGIAAPVIIRTENGFKAVLPVR